MKTIIVTWTLLAALLAAWPAGAIQFPDGQSPGEQPCVANRGGSIDMTRFACRGVRERAGRDARALLNAGLQNPAWQPRFAQDGSFSEVAVKAVAGVWRGSIAVARADSRSPVSVLEVRSQNRGRGAHIELDAHGNITSMGAFDEVHGEEHSAYTGEEAADILRGLLLDLSI